MYKRFQNLSKKCRGESLQVGNTKSDKVKIHMYRIGFITAYRCLPSLSFQSKRHSATNQSISNSIIFINQNVARFPFFKHTRPQSFDRLPTTSFHRSAVLSGSSAAATEQQDAVPDPTVIDQTAAFRLEIQNNAAVAQSWVGLTRFVLFSSRFVLLWRRGKTTFSN